jgi:hypothetical protein
MSERDLSELEATQGGDAESRMTEDQRLATELQQLDLGETVEEAEVLATSGKKVC